MALVNNYLHAIHRSIIRRIPLQMTTDSLQTAHSICTMSIFGCELPFSRIDAKLILILSAIFMNKSNYAV